MKRDPALVPLAHDHHQALAVAQNALLSEHVRLEERQLFPQIEHAMPEAELAVVAVALEQGHG